jgi:two-component system, OmpR family, phosphate regulon response regulator PhoB
MTDTVLIVDEDVNARIIAETLLRARGLHVLAATDAEEACDIICCEGVAVVVLALDVADTRGLEVLRRLRGRFETRTLPAQPRVVVVADWAEPAVERLAIGLGADAFVRRPVSPAQFIQLIERLVAEGSPCVVPAASGF